VHDFSYGLSGHTPVVYSSIPPKSNTASDGGKSVTKLCNWWMVFMRISEAASQQTLQLLSQITKGESSVGEILTGRVLSVDNGLILIRLVDGSQISARTPADAQYLIGEVINLEILEEKQDLIFARRVGDPSEQGGLYKDAELDPSIMLKKLGLPVESRYIEILKAVYETGTEPTADIVKKALQLLTDGQVKDPKQAAFLACNDMAEKPLYFPVLKNLTDGVFNFQKEWSNATQEINLLDDKTIMEIAEGFLVNDIIHNMDFSEASIQIEKLIESGMRYKGSGSGSGSGALPVSIKPMVANFIKSILSGILSSKKSFQSIHEETTAGLLDSSGISSTSAAVSDTATANATSTTTSTSTSASTSAEFTGNIFADNFILNSNYNEILETVTEQYFPENTISDKSQQDEITTILNNLLLQIKETIPNKPLTVDEAKKIISGSISKLIEKTASNSSEVNLPNIDEWADDTKTRLNIIKEALVNSTAPQRESVLVQVSELETALSFFQDIISYEAFAQIPLILNNNTTDGEIYIMKRKNKRRKLDPDDFSVFLSLTTTNLGTLDTFINVRNKNVLLRFMTDDEKHFGLLQDKYKHLYEALKAKGFNLYEIKCSLREEGIHLMNANKKASDILYAKNKKIDIRI
jgi:hypothetical protein